MEVRSPGVVAPAARIALRVGGAGLLFATAAIHLDLYLTGYRTIPTIGWLFLLQVIVAFGLGAIVLVFGGALATAGAAAFALSTLGGYLVSLKVGLFDFREVRTTAGITAGVIEVVALAVLSTLAVDALTRPALGRRLSGRGKVASALRTRTAMALWTSSALSVLAAVVFGLALATESTTQSAAATTALEVATVNGAAVVTNDQGLTLYWFAPDTSSTSVCFGTCAVYWPPVIGRPRAGAGLPGRIGSIARSNGVRQATYDGHPLYTYVADTAPGQANGDDIDLNGGLWHAMRASG